MKHTISDFTIHPLEDPSYISPLLVRYNQNGIAKSWEVVQASDSVAILIYHTQKEAFVLVKQFRPAVYLNRVLTEPKITHNEQSPLCYANAKLSSADSSRDWSLFNNIGVTHELCAGMVDKELSLEDIAREEIEEECGYVVLVENIQKVATFHTSVGFAGSKQNLYYTEVDESMRISEGGGVDLEMIEVVYLPVSEAKAMIFDNKITTTPGLMFAFLWWLERSTTR